MRSLLLLISRLDYSGPARRLCLLARGLAREEFRVRVVVLGTEAPWVESLRTEGIEVEVLGWQRPIDVRPFLALRRLLQTERPDVVHVFGTTALRAARLCGVRQVIASDLLRGGRPLKGWTVDRRLLNRVERVVTFGTSEARRYQHYGVATEQITVATPGVDLMDNGGEAVGWPAGRVILCIGPLEAHKGFRDAVWAFDILQYLFDDLRLVFLGDGPDRQRVADFAQAVGAACGIHFLGSPRQVEPFLRRAAVVWVPGRTASGVCAALEATAAGRPVVASSIPELAEIIVEGETGYLVPPGDKAALARQTRLLLDDETLANRLADAGRQRATERFGAEQMVAAFAEIYRQIAG